jgi:hypothetical protein
VFAHAAGHSCPYPGSAATCQSLEFPAQVGQRDLSVPVLAAFLLACHDRARRPVPEPDCCLATVDVLAAGTARPKRFNIALGKQRIVSRRYAYRHHYRSDLPRGVLSLPLDNHPYELTHSMHRSV